MSAATLRNNTEKHRYELVEQGQVVGVAEYALEGNEVIFRHTEIGSEHEGKGYGSALAKQALDDVVAQNKKIVPLCSFIAGYVDKHPEYADAVASRS